MKCSQVMQMALPLECCSSPWWMRPTIALNKFSCSLLQSCYLLLARSIVFLGFFLEIFGVIGLNHPTEFMNNYVIRDMSKEILCLCSIDSCNFLKNRIVVQFSIETYNHSSPSNINPYLDTISKTNAGKNIQKWQALA